MFNIPDPDSSIGGFRGSIGEKTSSHLASNLNSLTSDVAHLKHHLGRLMLLNQALWELLQQKMGLSEAELLALVEQIDLRDGKADGKLTEHPLRCPKCTRVNSSRHQRCLYCGQEFEGDLFTSTGR